MVTLRHWLIVYTVLVASLLLASLEYTKQPTGTVQLHVFGVGQGDAMLLVSPSGKQIVVDGGPNLDLLEHLGKHMPLLDRTIELLVLSHPDADHITALPAVLQRYHVERILLSGAVHESSRYQALLEEIRRQHTSVLIADPSQDIDIGDGLYLDVLWPHDLLGKKPKNPNDPSVVIKALYGNQSILLSGDIGIDAEAALIASGVDVKSTILKVPHHSSRTSSSTGLLVAVQPELAIVSYGANNSFGHPHEDVVSRYAEHGISLLHAHEGNSIHLELDGSNASYVVH